MEYHPHFIKALQENGLALPDVMSVLHSGIVYDEPEFNVRFQQWRYKVEGKEYGGKWVAIVYSFLAEEEALIITAFLKQN